MALSLTVALHVKSPTGRKPTLVGKVEEIINSTPGEHTVASLLKHLEATGWVFVAQDKNVAIGTAVRTLVEQKKIRLVSRGTGGTPNVYAKALEGKKTKAACLRPPSSGFVPRSGSANYPMMKGACLMRYIRQLYHASTARAVWLWWFWLPALGLEP